MLMIHRSPKPIQMEWHLLRRFEPLQRGKGGILARFFSNQEVSKWGCFHRMDIRPIAKVYQVRFSFLFSQLFFFKAGQNISHFSHWRKAAIKGIQKNLYDTYTLNTTCIRWLMLALRLYLFYFSKASQPICFSCSLPCITHECGFSKTV